MIGPVRTMKEIKKELGLCLPRLSSCPWRKDVPIVIHHIERDDLPQGLALRANYEFGTAIRRVLRSAGEVLIDASRS
jgi:hypothetical protein